MFCDTSESNAEKGIWSFVSGIFWNEVELENDMSGEEAQEAPISSQAAPRAEISANEITKTSSHDSTEEAVSDSSVSWESKPVKRFWSERKTYIILAASLLSLVIVISIALSVGKEDSRDVSRSVNSYTIAAPVESELSISIPSHSSDEEEISVTVPSHSSDDSYLTPATFVPGNLTIEEEGLLLSQGLRARIIGVSGQKVSYHDGNSSEILFHSLPDFGATFRDTRPFNRGGWVYASNSEVKEQGEGGVGSITFDKDGNVIDYRMVLEGTTMNCGGGRTPWNTWVSCEEVEFFGEIYQVDPFGERPAEKATIGSELGRWESFAFDVRDSADPRFFATEDHNKGTVRRFRPESKKIDWDSPWDMLHEDGIIDYLFVNPDIRENETTAGGTFEWTNDIEAARFNAREFYPQTEGIDIYNGTMYVVCKRIKQMFVFDLDTMTYYNQSTVTGLFDGGPDQMQRILDDDPGDLLFFTEEGGKDAGIHARDNLGRFYTVFESPVYQDETTGLAFSPDGKHMYVAYQVNGLLFDIWREDGLSFGARTLNVKYHHVD